MTLISNAAAILFGEEPNRLERMPAFEGTVKRRFSTIVKRNIMTGQSRHIARNRPVLGRTVYLAVNA
jgi:hypothetical protein